MQEQTITVQFPQSASYARLADEPTLALVANLHSRFAPRLRELIEQRQLRQTAYDNGEWPASIPANSTDNWLTSGAAQALRDRRVEWHCMPDDDSLPAALVSAASTVVIDLCELLPVDGAALSALWSIARSLSTKALESRNALIFGMRDLACREPLVLWGTEPAHAALVDIALFLGHNSASMDAVCLKLSRLESVAEAEFWRDIFGYMESSGVVARDQINATLAIETVPAVFAIDALMYALKDYVAALTLDHSSCLASLVRAFREFPQFVLPDAAELTGSTHLLQRWELLLVQHAHRRGALAIGSPSRWQAKDADNDNRVFGRLRVENERQIRAGFDGSGVADEAFVAAAREVFDRMMPGQHQLHRLRADTHIVGADLLQVPKGKITESGLRTCLAVTLRGLLAIKKGQPTLNLNQCRETPASIELAAGQLRHWVSHATGVLDDGRIVDEDYFLSVLDEESANLGGPGISDAGLAKLLADYVLGRATSDFLLANSP
ncbi:MAG: hypothetical protein RIA65_12675 [Woeseia sp.]